MINYFIMLMMLMNIIMMNNWLTLWISMEIINLMITSLMFKNNELMTKFYLFQTILSLILILTIINNNSILIKLMKTNLITIIIWIKMNMFPFNQWIMSINKSMNWNQFIMINFLTKSPNMMILNYSMNYQFMNMFIMTIILTLMNLNSINLKSILTMLSINNMPWFMMLMFFSSKLSMLLMLIYFLMNIMLISNLNKEKINFINHITNQNYLSMMKTIILIFNLMSIPPMMMFLMKWFIIKMMLINKMMLMMMIMINSMNLIIMNKMTIMLSIKFNMKMKWINNNKKKKNLWMLTNNLSLINLI